MPEPVGLLERWRDRLRYSTLPDGRHSVVTADWEDTAALVLLASRLDTLARLREGRAP